VAAYAGAVGPVARAEALPGDGALSAEAVAAREAGHADMADYLLLKETEACLAAHRGPADCARLLVDLLERSRGYNHFALVPTGTSAWNGDPAFDYVEANGKRAEALAGIAAAHVVARYGVPHAYLSIGASAPPPADAAERLAIMARALRWVALGDFDERADTLLANSIAVLLAQLGRSDAALKVLQGPGLIKTLSQPQAELFGAGAAETAMLLNNEAVLEAYRAGVPDAAKLERAAAILAAAPGVAEADLAVVQLNLARALHETGDNENAERLYRRWLPVLASSAGATDPRHAVAVVDRAKLVAGLGRGAEALALLDAASPVREGKGDGGADGEADREAIAIAAELARADALQALGKRDDAQALLGREVAARGTVLAAAPIPALQVARAPDWLSEMLAHPEDVSASARDRLLGDLYRRHAEFLGDAGQTAQALETVAVARRLNGWDLEAQWLEAWLKVIAVKGMAANGPEVMAMTPEEMDRNSQLHADARTWLQNILAVAGSDSLPVAIKAHQAMGVLEFKNYGPLGAVESFQKASAGARGRIAGLHNYDESERRELERYRDTFRTEMLTDAMAARALENGSTSWQGRSAADLVNDAFVAAQWSGQSAASAALARLAARFSRGAGPLAEMEKQRQDLARRSEAADRAYSALLGQTGEADTAARAEAAAARDRLASDLAAIEARMAQADPAYADLTRPTAMTMADVQALLAPDEAMVLMVPSMDATYVFAINRDTFGWTRAETWAEKPLGEAVTRLRAAIGGAGASRATTLGSSAAAAKAQAFDRSLAHSLYTGLLAPVETVLAGKARVMTVTSGALGELPLALLVTDPPEGADADHAALAGTRWLADRFALTTLPSVSSLKALRCLLVPAGTRVAGCKGATGQRTAAPRTAAKAPLLAGVGAPTLRGAPQADTRAPPYAAAFSGNLADTAFLRKLAWLPGSLAELNAVARDFPQGSAVIVTGDAATEGAVKDSAAIAGAQYVIFSTHGLLASQSSVAGEPGLVFTPPEESAKSDRDDGLLTASEAAALRLQAELVVLSACNTAASDGSAGGEGLSGLARGFFYAGARSLMVSHWPVSDEATSRLITGVFQRLRAKEAPARALQQAMGELRRDPRWASPEYWAPFVLVGTGS